MDSAAKTKQYPLGIDAARPGLTWMMNSDRRGDFQSAYQVLVASTPEKLRSGRGDLVGQRKSEFGGQRLRSLLGRSAGVARPLLSGKCGCGT